MRETGYQDDRRSPQYSLNRSPTKANRFRNILALGGVKQVEKNDVTPNRVIVVFVSGVSMCADIEAFDACVHLRSATQQLMVVPQHRLSTVGRRAFAVHGPVV